MRLVLQWLLGGLSASNSRHLTSVVRPRRCRHSQTSVALGSDSSPAELQHRKESLQLTSHQQSGEAKPLDGTSAGNGRAAPSRTGCRAGHKRLSPNFEWLYYESDVTGGSPGGTRLVDRVDYMQDPRLWSRLLQFRRRIHGVEGVIAIWKGLYKRKIILPVRGPEADILWRGFLDAALRNNQMLDELLDYSETLIKEHGKIWDGFQETIVSHFLRAEPSKAYNMHQLLKDWCPVPQDYLARIIRSWPGTTESLYVLERIYKESSVRNLYSTIVPLLCHRGRYYDAYRWHRFLIQHGDVPITKTPAEPLLHHLTLWGEQSQMKAATEGLRSYGGQSTGKIRKENEKDPVFSREEMNRLYGKVFFISEKRLSDSFCARLFATKAFSVDVILNGLHILGVDEIGPLSMRELAAREGNPDSISRRIEQLSKAGISIGSSKFSQLVKKFAVEKETELLEDMLASDQHPDVLDDRNLQEALLASYLRANDMRQVRKTLAILTAFKRDPKTMEYNLILRTHLREGNRFAIDHVLHDMKDANVTLTSSSSRSLLRYLARYRNKGKNPVVFPQKQDDLGLTVRILLGVLHSGSTLTPSIWKGVFRRLGMAGRLDELERLALWLASFYSPSLGIGAKHRYAPSRAVLTSSFNSAAPAYIPEEVPAHHPAHPLRMIFSTALQKSIIAWGFINGPKDVSQQRSGVSESKPWTHGLRILRLLAERGVYVQKTPVRQAFMKRLIILYGPGRSFKRRNRRLRRFNTVPITVMIREAEETWGSALFNGKEPWWDELFKGK